MNKLILKVDLTKLDKSKIKERKYTDKNGVEQVAKEYTMELIELKAPKFVTQGKDWEMVKTHFIVDPQSKEEREAKKPSNFLGDGIVFNKKTDFSDIADDISVGVDGEVINKAEIPF